VVTRGLHGRSRLLLLVAVAKSGAGGVLCAAARAGFALRGAPASAAAEGGRSPAGVGVGARATPHWLSRTPRCVEPLGRKWMLGRGKVGGAGASIGGVGDTAGGWRALVGRPPERFVLPLVALTLGGCGGGGGSSGGGSAGGTPSVGFSRAGAPYGMSAHVGSTLDGSPRAKFPLGGSLHASPRHGCSLHLPATHCWRQHCGRAATASAAGVFGSASP